jgi:hypothetical protein
VTTGAPVLPRRRQRRRLTQHPTFHRASPRWNGGARLGIQASSPPNHFAMVARRTYRARARRIRRWHTGRASRRLRAAYRGVVVDLRVYGHEQLGGVAARFAAARPPTQPTLLTRAARSQKVLPNVDRRATSLEAESQYERRHGRAVVIRTRLRLRLAELCGQRRQERSIHCGGLRRRLRSAGFAALRFAHHALGRSVTRKPIHRNGAAAS